MGKGSVFAIYLPTTEGPDEIRSYEEGDLPCGNERILFVDDELSISEIATQILERLGYAVTTRTSSEEALEIFRMNPVNFDLVITDMTMPNMTGDKTGRGNDEYEAGYPGDSMHRLQQKNNSKNISKIGIKAIVYKTLIKADLAKTVRKALGDAKG